MVLNHSLTDPIDSHTLFQPSVILINSHNHLKYREILVKNTLFWQKDYVFFYLETFLYDKNTFWMDYYQSMCFYWKKSLIKKLVTDVLSLYMSSYAPLSNKKYPINRDKFKFVLYVQFFNDFKHKSYKNFRCL